MTNVAFLRTSIELLERFFAPGEVAEIWITFPDPQMKKASKRLTGTRMMGVYSHVMAPGGRIHLKTDSPFLYAYTRPHGLRNGPRCRPRYLTCTAPTKAPNTSPRHPHTPRAAVARPWPHNKIPLIHRPRDRRPLAELPEAANLSPTLYRLYSRGCHSDAPTHSRQRHRIIWKHYTPALSPTPSPTVRYLGKSSRSSTSTWWPTTSASMETR